MRKVRLALGGELESKQSELDDLSTFLMSKDAKVAEAQQAHATVVRKQGGGTAKSTSHRTAGLGKPHPEPKTA